MNAEIQIGTQIWMSTNLDVSHYRNGDLIVEVTDQNKWGDIVGVCIAPVTAQVIMTLLCFAFEALIDSFLIDESTHRDILHKALYNTK